MYADDLIIICWDPKSIMSTLINAHIFKLKGTGLVTFHLRCDFFCDKDETLCYAPRKYVKKMMDNYKWIFGRSPKFASSPLMDGDHPELNITELLNAEDTKIYQSLIGACQWVMPIGRFNVTTAVMTMYRFRVALQQGHILPA